MTGRNLGQIGLKRREMDDRCAVDDGIVVIEHQTGKPHNTPPQNGIWTSIAFSAEECKKKDSEVFS